MTDTNSLLQPGETLGPAAAAPSQSDSNSLLQPGETLGDPVAAPPTGNAGTPEHPLVTPLPGEPFEQTMQRGAAMGKQATPEQLETAKTTALKEVPDVIGASLAPAYPMAAAIGAGTYGVGTGLWEVGKGLVTKTNPFTMDTVKDVAESTAEGAMQGPLWEVGGKALGSGAKAVMSKWAPSKQAAADAVAKVLGKKADVNVVSDVLDRLPHPKYFSTLENDIKLVKPKIDAEVAENTTKLNDVLAKSPAVVKDAAHQVQATFDNLVTQAKAGVSDIDTAVKSINEVRQRVVAKLANGDTPAQAVNDVKRLVGDEVKKFAPPDLLNSAQKWEQEAYQQAYHSLKDIVSAAEPAVKDLNAKIARGIHVQDILEKKFPTLTTEAQAAESYAGQRVEAAKDVVKKAALKVGGSVIAGGAIGAGYEAVKHAIGE